MFFFSSAYWLWQEFMLRLLASNVKERGYFLVVLGKTCSIVQACTCNYHSICNQRSDLSGVNSPTALSDGYNSRYTRRSGYAQLL